MTKDYKVKYRMDLEEGRDYRIREEHSLPGRSGSGIVVIGRTVYARGKLKKVPPHEYLHLAQYRKYGTLRVLIHYWFFFTWNCIRFLNIKKAFSEIPFECEARDFENSITPEENIRQEPG